jgi:hypothetical protein
MSNESDLTAELAAENSRLKQENQDLLRALHALTHENLPVRREEILANIGKSPSFGAFLDDLEARHVTQ